MTRSRLILVLRICLLSVIALWFGVPWWIVGPVALMIPAGIFRTTVSCGSGAICSDGTAGGSVQVVITGIANSTCTSCSNWNGTFIVPYSALIAGCSYTMNNSVACAGSTAESLTVFMSLSGGNFHIRVEIVEARASPLGFAVVDFDYTNGAGPVDCSTFSSLNIPFTSISGVSSCDVSAAAASVTSI